MKIKHLRIRTVVISYLVFFTGWTLRVVCVDLSGMNDFLCTFCANQLSGMDFCRI